MDKYDCKEEMMYPMGMWSSARTEDEEKYVQMDGALMRPESCAIS